MQVSRDTVIKMAEISGDALQLSAELLQDYNENKAKLVESMEQRVDRYEDALATYLLKVSGRDLKQADSRMVSILLHCINRCGADFRPCGEYQGPGGGDA